MSKQFSAEVVDKCVNLLNSLAKDDTVLAKVAAALYQLTSLQAPSVAVKPGFVIRTKRLLPPQWKKEKSIEKVYINVFHHESIDMVYKTDGGKIGIDDTDVDDFSELVVVTCGEAALTEDADGSQCVLYNLAVSSQYFASTSFGQCKNISSGNAVRQVIIYKYTFFQFLHQIFKLVHFTYFTVHSGTKYEVWRLLGRSKLFSASNFV